MVAACSTCLVGPALGCQERLSTIAEPPAKQDGLYDFLDLDQDTLPYSGVKAQWHHMNATMPKYLVRELGEDEPRKAKGFCRRRQEQSSFQCC